eukprot:5337398-Alexandrium_andersonii.AAC.1
MSKAGARAPLQAGTVVRTRQPGAVRWHQNSREHPSTHPASGGCRGARRKRPCRHSGGDQVPPDHAHERAPIKGLAQALQKRRAELEDTVKCVVIPRA